jgi:hypothetical protein
MSEIINLSYTIAPSMANRLGGLFLVAPLAINQEVHIKGYTYRVTRCTPLLAKYFVPSGIIKLDDLNGVVIQGGRLERLWKECGVPLRVEFVRAFFTNCEVTDLVGKRRIYLAEFTDISLLQGK